MKKIISTTTYYDTFVSFLMQPIGIQKGERKIYKIDTIETKNVQTQDVFQKIKYSFDPVGNVLGYANDASTYETQQTYSYDNLYQLISVE